MSTKTRASVVEFLLEAKRAIQRGDRGWIFSTGRRRNTSAMAELELTMEDVRNEILTLSVTDYCNGPLLDPKIRGDIWIFGKIIREREIYIKLKLWGDKYGYALRVLSFHPAEKPLSYPFRE